MIEQAKHSIYKSYDPADRKYYDYDVYFIPDLNLLEISRNGKVLYVGQGFLNGGVPVMLGQGKAFLGDALETVNAEFVTNMVIDGYCRVFCADYIQYCNSFSNSFHVPNVSARAIPHRFVLHQDLKNSTAQFTLYDPTARNIIDRFDVTQAGMNILKQDLDFRRSHAKSCGNTHGTYGEFRKWDDNSEAGLYELSQIKWGIQKKANSYYIGEFLFGNPHGWGKVIYNNGIYVGEYPGKKQGFGAYRWNNGEEYAGTWQDDHMHGYGVYFFKDGCYYAGEWKNEQRDGYGTYVWNDGSRRSGRYSNGKFVG